MAEPFSRTFRVRWADMDFNAHMRNTAYLDLAGDVRMLYFESEGFPMREFERLRIGPVILRDELDYFRELRLLEPVTVTLALAGVSDDASRFRLRNEFLSESGTVAARVTSAGGWLDLETRRLAPPPEALAAAVGRLSRTDDFAPIAPRAGRGS